MHSKNNRLQLSKESWVSLDLWKVELWKNDLQDKSVWMQEKVMSTEFLSDIWLEEINPMNKTNCKTVLFK